MTKQSYTHYMCCYQCHKVVMLCEQETVDRWPNGYPRQHFRHNCTGDPQRSGHGTTAPRKIPDGPMSREEALSLVPFSNLDWPS